MADLAKIKRNVGRMVEQGAPESDIDEYISGEGVNLADVRAFKGGPSPDVQKEVKFRQKLGAGGMGMGLADNLSFGAFNPVSAGLAAAGKTAVKALTGQPTDIAGDYRFERDVLDGLLKEGRDERGLGGTVGEIALSIPFLGGKAAAGAAGAVAGQVASNLAQLGTLAKQGAAYGGIYGFNSARGGVGEHIENTALNAGAGAVLAPGLKLGIDGASKVAQLPAQVGRYLTSRSADDIANVQAREADFAQAGVRSFGPAITESPTQRRTAAGLAGSVFGAPLRREAQGAVDDATAAVQRSVREPIGFQPVNDVGAEIQQTLKRNLVERSIPSNEVAGMASDDLARITGPIDDRGFAPPPPKVDPIPPRQVDPVPPQAVNPDELAFEIAKPRTVQRGEVRPVYPEMKDAPINPELANRANLLEREAEVLRATAMRTSQQFDEIAAARGKNGEEYWQLVGRGQKFGGVTDPEARAVYEAAVKANTAFEQASAAVREAKSAATKSQEDAWRESVRQAHAKASADAEGQYIRESAAATREAQEATQAARQRAILQAEADAQAKAQAETARLRAEAEYQAKLATQRAEAEAMAKYEADRRSVPGFEPGRSRESYPTEFDAAYTQLNRETPTFQRNPVGGGGISGSKSPTNTERLLEEFAGEMRSANKLKGYKGGSVFGAENMPRPDFLTGMREKLGDDIAGRLESYMQSRSRQITPGPQGLRDLGTAIRRAKQQAQRPQFPAQPMPERAAALARLEGAIKSDYYQFMRETGPKGQRLVDMTQNVDSEYGKFVTEFRKPLAKLFDTDKVSPLEAMNRITKAAEDGDLRMLRSYMRVMSEKGDPAKGAGAVVAHLTNNASDLGTFVKGYSALSDDVKAVLFVGDKGKTMRQSLDRVARVAERLAPYEKALKAGGGVDLTNRTNIYVGLSAMAHPVLTAALSAGAIGASKFMASPRYSAWLTRAAQAKTRQAVSVEYGRLAAFLSRDTELPEAFKAQILEAAKTGKAPEQKDRPPGMMKLGGPKEGDTEAAQQQPEDDGGMADVIAKAAQSKGIDLERAKPQDVIDAAWDASPTDRMGEAIEFIAKRHGLRLPWESDDENKRARP